MTLLLIITIGILGGIASGLFGIGGGTVFVPLLILALGVKSNIAIGTSLGIVVPTALIGLIRHQIGGTVDWKYVGLLVVFAGVGAWVGASFSTQVDALLMRRIFAVFMVIMAIKMFFPN